MGGEFMSSVAIVFSLALITWMAWKKFSPILIGPICVIAVGALSGLPVFKVLSVDFMETAAGFIKGYYLTFLTGAIFGKIMGESGAAASVADFLIKIFGKKQATLVLVLTTALLVYGGMSVFVGAFVLYPIGLILYKEQNLPKKLIPGALALGLWTFAMTGPGSTQIQNIVPMKYLGTTGMAGFIPGAAASLFMAVCGILYLQWEARQCAKRGEVFEASSEIKAQQDVVRPPASVAFAPSLAVIILFNLFKIDIVIAMTIGILLGIALWWKYIPLENWMKYLNEGASNSAIVISNTAIIVGYAGVVRLTPVFPKIVAWLKGIAGQGASPLWFVGFSTELLAGIAASSSGGLGLVYGSLGDTFAKLGTTVRPEYIHRLTSICAGGLDTLPHCGAIFTLLWICGLTHKDSYKYIFVTNTVIPVIAAFFVAIPLMILIP